MRASLKIALWVGVLGVIGLGAGVRWAQDAPLAGLAFRELHVRLDTVDLIGIEDRASAVTLRRAGGVWTVVERGGFPADPDKVAGLLNGLARARGAQLLHAQPAAQDAASLAEPRDGGPGVRVALHADGRGPLLDLIISANPDGVVRWRWPGQASAWRAPVALPRDLAAPIAWLDLELLPAAMRSRIARVEVVRPESGPAYALARSAAGAAFQFAAPFDQAAVVAPVGLSATAHALVSTVPLDVAPAGAVRGAAFGEAMLATFDGLHIRGAIVGGPELRWLRLRFEAVAPDRVQEAAALSARLSPWAFHISDLDARTILAPARSFVRY